MDTNALYKKYRLEKDLAHNKTIFMSYAKEHNEMCYQKEAMQVQIDKLNASLNGYKDTISNLEQQIKELGE